MPEPPKIVPMWSARVADLRPGMYVGCICDACGHAADIAVTTIQERVDGWEFANTLFRKLRCEKCGERGRCVVNLRSALGYV